MRVLTSSPPYAFMAWCLSTGELLRYIYPVAFDGVSVVKDVFQRENIPLDFIVSLQR
jgi:hypothetical protein